MEWLAAVVIFALLYLSFRYFRPDDTGSGNPNPGTGLPGDEHGDGNHPGPRT